MSTFYAVFACSVEDCGRTVYVECEESFGHGYMVGDAPEGCPDCGGEMRDTGDSESLFDMRELARA